jgi:beta-glucosidase
MTDTPFTPMESFGPVPAGWVWGTATAAHQVEGGNVNNDWWEFEHDPASPAIESSGDACNSWHLWRRDLELVKGLGLDSYRFSLEWSRIEPAEGEFSIAALDHYREILEACHEMGLQTCVTFHHFTTPLWMAHKGGWANPEIVDRFARFCGVAVEHLGDLIDVACTLNEPNMVALVGYWYGNFPPGHINDFAGFDAATDNMVAAHHAARKVLKTGPGDFPVGLTHALFDFVLHADDQWDGPTLTPDEIPPDSDLARYMRGVVTAYLDAAREDDFIGVQTYFTEHVGLDGQKTPRPAGIRETKIGWLFTPEAIGAAVRWAAEYTSKPVIITENGIATDDDEERIEYYSRALASVREALDDGVDIRGYYAWSLLDNFEWPHGFSMKFGLHSVDRETFERTPKPSADFYRRIVASSRG